MHTRKSQSISPRTNAVILRERAVGTAITHLPDSLRWVMLLGERGGLSTREIADLAGVGSEEIEFAQDQGLSLIQKEFLQGQTALPAKKK